MLHSSLSKVIVYSILVKRHTEIKFPCIYGTYKTFVVVTAVTSPDLFINLVLIVPLPIALTL